MSSNTGFRTWKTDSVPSRMEDSSSSAEPPRPSNPFQRQQRQPRESEAASSYSYNQWKLEKQKAEEKKKAERPLTQDDFPPLGGAVNATLKKQVPATSVYDGSAQAETLASRIANAIKRDEAETLRKKREAEELKSSETFTALPMMSIRSGLSAQKVKAEERRIRRQTELDDQDYQWQISSEIEEPIEH
jgi:hypothetical protein